MVYYKNLDAVPEPEVIPAEADYSMGLMNETKTTVQDVEETISAVAMEVNKALEHTGRESAKMFVKGASREEIFEFLDKNQDILMEYLDEKENTLTKRLTDLEDRVAQYADKSVASMIIEDIKGVVVNAKKSIETMKSAVKDFFTQARETVVTAIENTKSEIAYRFAVMAEASQNKIEDFTDKATENIAMVALGIKKSVDTTIRTFHSTVQNVRQDRLENQVKNLEMNYALMRQQLEQYAASKGLEFPAVTGQKVMEEEAREKSEVDREDDDSFDLE